MESIRPGLYLRGDVAYAAINAVNYSSLKHIGKSALQYRHALENGTPDTASKFRGTAAHVATLEPHRFLKEFAVFEGERRAGKAWEAFKAEHEGKLILKQDEFDAAMAIRDAVRSHPVAGKYLRKGVVEPTLVWDDPESGVRMKGRPDFISDDGVVVDLKSTKDVTSWSFGKDAFNYAYHVQAALYLDGYELATKKHARSVIIAVEQKAPHDVCVYTLDDDTLGIGRDAYRSMLAKLVECEKARAWPGYAAVAEMPLKLPAYAMPDESDLDALGLEM